MKFKEEILRTIEREALFLPHDKLLVALSGGADSVALLRVLLQLGYACECAHCNFHLRGEESNRDEAFVRQLCQSLGVKLHVTHFDTEAHAKAHQLSIEMSARELRYTWFASLLEADSSLKHIAVAHHRDDNIETLLINLVRGTGINGLTGIPSVNGRIVRPLLDVSREDILAYLQRIGQPYVTDSTNLEDDFLRNKIRLNLLPMLEMLNPSVRKTLSDTIHHLKGVSHTYHHHMQALLHSLVQKPSAGEMHACISEVLALPSAGNFLYEWLYPLGFNPSQIADIHQSMRVNQPGKRFRSKEWEVLRDRHLLLVRRADAVFALPEIEVTLVEITPSFQIPTAKDVVCVDADKVQPPFKVRKWESGDTFVP
ncbi:MAG: tRNA lysidine(34) synthetase TilS, partial [Akkermansia sp.]|nr:tRNA lysidine(34) synthetase TilS [Akkermansia sp.]